VSSEETTVGLTPELAKIGADMDKRNVAYQEVELRPKLEAALLGWQQTCTALTNAALEAAYQAGRDDVARAVELLADLIVKCTEYGVQDGEFVAMYLLPTGPVHRAIPWLEERGIIVRPGFDGRNQEPS
jgi:hypothetical protein